MPTGRIKVRVWFNPIKNVFVLDIPQLDIRLKVTPRGVYHGDEIVAIGRSAEELYYALKTHNNITLSYILHNLLPVIQLLH
jgi:hypothetical protein